MKEDTVKKTYDEWIELLKHTGNESMQSNSFDVWIEAFHTGSILTKTKCVHAVLTELQLGMSEDFDDDTSMSVTDVKQLQASMLKKVVEIINDQQA
jgi:hypothetical protein